MTFKEEYTYSEAFQANPKIKPDFKKNDSFNPPTEEF